MTEHRHAAVIRAIINGDPVQFSASEPNIWLDATAISSINPLSFPDYDWRIKPKQQPKTVINRVCVEGVSYNEYGEGKPYSKRMNIDPMYIMPGDTLKLKVDVFL